ncbi:TetR/AcrR family transcriptional regulator [Nocardia sp. NPDC057668]|uniref:TetR/AcrR family transcriptional regulator n=1 Tax=Nocardia sp. NPDC057668 TaxID=3346202 RepID=UPI00366E7613
MVDATALGPERRVRLSGPEREQQLLDVAEGLFTERGYEGVTLDEIARTAGVSRPIVYQHHGSKDGIFIACVRRAREQFERSVIDSLDPADADMDSAIRAGGAPYFELIAANPRRWALLFTSSASLTGEVADQLTELRAATIARIAELARPFLHELPDHELTAFAYAISGIGEQLGRWWLQNRAVPQAQVLDLYCTLVVGAARALTGSSS